MGGSGGGSETTSSIPPQFLPFFVDLFERAQAASLEVSDQPFPGERFAPIASEQLQSLDQLTDLAGQFQGLGDPFIQLAQQTASGQFLDPATNPFLQSAIQAGIRPVQQQFQEQTLPAIRSAAIQQGAFGGNREGITEALAAGRANQQSLDISSSIAFQNFINERNLQQQSPGLAQAGAELSLLGPQLLGQIGDVRRGFDQEAIIEAIQRFNEAQQAPFAPLFPLANILQGTNVGNVSTTQLNPGSGGLSGVIQGGLGGAAAGSVFGPPGIIIGGVLGGAAGGFG